MRPSDLSGQPGSPNPRRDPEVDPGVDVGRFVSGIYNSCDRWCERCPMTAKGVVRSMVALRDACDWDTGLEDRVIPLLGDLG